MYARYIPPKPLRTVIQTSRGHATSEPELIKRRTERQSNVKTIAEDEAPGQQIWQIKSLPSEHSLKRLEERTASKTNDEFHGGELKPGVESNDFVKSHSPNKDVRTVSRFPQTIQTQTKHNKSHKRKRDEVQQPAEAQRDDERTLAQEKSNEVEVNVTPRRNEAPDKHLATFAKYKKSTNGSHELLDKELLVVDSPIHQTRLEENTSELAGLTPLPQPPLTTDVASEPTFSALPGWLAKPTVVSSTETRELNQFNISSRLVKSLKNQGIDKFFPIQTAILPLLLPGPAQVQGDLCISAATGSGKTLAYLIPIIETLRTRVITQLRALVIVPTRELVYQAHSVCQSCSAGTNLRIAMALGSRPLKMEQEELIETASRFDISAQEQDRGLAIGGLTELDYDPDADDVELELGMKRIFGHVYEHSSNADILICTPGRLVDHIRFTPGFTLRHIQWLVIDEADKLLSESFQGWMNVLSGVLEQDLSLEHISAPGKLSQALGRRSRRKAIRKVVLSATMTKDLSKLKNLRLINPTFVTTENFNRGREAGNSDENGHDTAIINPPGSLGNGYTLPATLQEWVIRAGNGSQKPLILLQLLQTELLKQVEHATLESEVPKSEPAPARGAGSPIYDGQTSSSVSSESSSDSALSQKPPRAGVQGPMSHSDSNRGVLIFTRSNESAIRLGRLLTLMHPPFLEETGILTSNHSSASRRQILKAFTSAKLCILIASDLVARGMDIQNLVHIVNYDLPSTVSGYVHRVGRTARAGRKGQAWTLVDDKEAKWFWNEIGRGPSITRATQVARHKIKEQAHSSELQEKYETALRRLGEEVVRER